jgi:NitT/TauT family transport system substrate-binding protein
MVARWRTRCAAIIAAVALFGPLSPVSGHAQTTLRVGKSQAKQFAFLPADIGVDAGLFKKHGLDLDISTFAGDAKEMQAMSAGGLDIALGGCPSLASIVKGAPMKAVAVFSGAPNIVMLTVLKDSPLKTAQDLKGHTVSVSGAGSLTFWLTQQLSRRLGWGDDGIKITPLGASEAQIAALMTHQIEGTTTDSVTVEKFVETGNGRILVNFGEYFPDFVSSCIYASTDLIANKPDALRTFLVGWFETIGYMHDHKSEIVAVAAKQLDISANVANAIYDDTMPTMSREGKFKPKALDILADSFVDMKLLPTKPDMTQLYTEAYLSK